LTRFEFNEEIGELPYAAACVGASRLLIQEVSGLNTIDLFERMWDTMTATEQMHCNAYMEDIRREESRSYSR
jgi:hypothetical protein